VSFRLVYLIVGAAVAAELAAIHTAVVLNRADMLPAALGLHILAALLALLAARRRRPGLSTVEGDTVLVTAFFVPLFGPAVGWTLPAPPRSEDEDDEAEEDPSEPETQADPDSEGEEPVDLEDSIENAHAIFERYSAHVKPDLPDYERTLFTGDYERDLARELDAESYHEVLRHGNTDQKRNALRRLADMGAPRHFALVRRCLLDPEHEVRLYAYSELERCGRVFEEEIAKRSRELDRRPGKPEALLALARVQFAYADTGIHDVEMAAFYFRTAARFATQARAAAPNDPEPIWIEARALARLKEYAEAETCLERLSPEQQEMVQSCIARADVAFRKRDFDAARTEAEKLRAQEAELPCWLAALEIRHEEG